MLAQMVLALVAVASVARLASAFASVATFVVAALKPIAVVVMLAGRIPAVEPCWVVAVNLVC